MTEAQADPRESLGSTGSGESQIPKSQPMYGVVLGLPDEFRQEMAARREKYCPQAARRIFPHITLRAPFTLDTPEVLAPALEAVARHCLPIHVSASGLGSFIGEHNTVLYVKVERSEELVRLHEAVVHALPNVRDCYPYAPSHQFENWVPHITIADGLTEERLHELFQELASQDHECEWDAREILLVRSESDEAGAVLWTTTRAFRGGS